MSDSFMTPWTSRLLCPWDFPGKKTGVGIHFLLQGIFLTQGLSPHLLHWQVDSLPLSYLGSSKKAYLRLKFATSTQLPCGSAGKESTCNAGDLGLIPGLGKSPGERKGYPLQYSGLENSMDYIVYGVAKSWTWLSNFHSLTQLQLVVAI